jgi:hypothetical protein
LPPIQPSHFWLYYAVATLVAILLFARRGPRKGMRLRFKGKGSQKKRELETARDYSNIAAELKGSVPPAPKSATAPNHEETTQIRAGAARPLNVHFNYNGHSWDAFEVLGLPAGSSMEKVEAAYKESLARVDVGSRPFMEAAFKAIAGASRQLKASS